VKTIDTKHLGRERVIAAFLLDGALIDTGPSTVHDTLVEGIGDERPERVLLTHIHLDHSGGAGKLVQRWPDLEVWVHERGARHLADPSKLVASASRLWGEVVPVPQENPRVLTGGETIGPWRVAYTPGHASHHVSYLHEPTGTALTGDTAGVRIPPDGPVLAPTPPPDIDLEAWPRSIDTIAAWKPERLAVTHFGAWEDPQEHLAALREQLDRQIAWAREAPDGDAFADRVRAHVASTTSPETAAAYEQGMPPDHLYPGLERALSRVSSPQT
jgi:glyoxylase-like metal-dependent hydrolase (beta-lactamase superfamily II)